MTKLTKAQERKIEERADELEMMFWDAEKPWCYWKALSRAAREFREQRKRAKFYVRPVYLFESE